MALVVTIAGTDRTSVTDFDNLTVTQVADSYTFTAEVTLNDRDSDITIVAGSHKAADEITIVQDAVTFFGGYVDDIDFTCQEDGSRSQHLHCVGYGVLLGETTVEYEEYDPAEAGLSDGDIIVDIFTTYLAAITTVLAPGGDIAELVDPLDILFEEMTVDEIMVAICNRTGGRFYVDNSKVLHYFSAETADAGFDLSDTPDEVNSFAYRDRPEKARTGGHIINKARIIGADGFATTRTDAASQASYGIQGAIVTDNTLFADAELQERGDDVLNDNKDPRDKYVVMTTHAGAVAGDKIDFKCGDLGYDSIGGGDPKLYIREMHVRWEQGDPVYQMTLGELEYSNVSKSKALSTQVKSIVLALGKSGHHRWGHNLNFSATDLNTVAWTSGKLVSDDGNTVYDIIAGNSGNMAATTYIYLEPTDNVTTLKNATDIEAIFGNKNIILIATCHPVAAGLAEFQVLLGGHATPGGTAVHDHRDADAGDTTLRPKKMGVGASVGIPDQDGTISLREVAADPSAHDNAGMLYCKSSTDITGLYLRRDDDDIIRLDDFTLYLLLDGTRPMTGDLDLDGNKLIWDADGDTKEYETADDEISWEIAGSIAGKRDAAGITLVQGDDLYLRAAASTPQSGVQHAILEKLGHIVDGGHASNPYPSSRNAADSEFNNATQNRNNTIHITNWAAGDFWSWFGTTPTGTFETYNVDTSEKSHLFVRKHPADGFAGESILRGNTQPAFPCTFYSLFNVMGSARGAGAYMAFGVMFSEGTWKEVRLTDAAANMTVTAHDAGGASATINLAEKVGAVKVGVMVFTSAGNLYVRTYAEMAGRQYYHTGFDIGTLHQWNLGATAGRTISYIYLKFGDIFANYLVDSVRRTT